jgi:hypothetical protein
MVGAAHYGLIVGRRLQDPRKDKNIYTRKIRRNWHEYGLPKPAYLTSTNMSQRTCLICLIQFVVAPDLMKIVAFNHDATAWGQLNGGEGPGALYITFLPGEDESDLLHISSPHDLQSSLRTDTFQRQEHFCPKVRKSWPLYTLPKPAYLSGQSKQTCLICLIQFVVAPELICKTLSEISHVSVS